MITAAIGLPIVAIAVVLLWRLTANHRDMS
jgi:hypothetical protein